MLGEKDHATKQAIHSQNRKTSKLLEKFIVVQSRVAYIV